MLQGKRNTFLSREKIIKGFSNHWRIQILELLGRQPELSLNDVSEILHMNLKTAAEHIRRLVIAGLVMKRYDARNVRHKVTALGNNILTFLRKLE